MINIVRYTQCPLCGSKDIAKVFSVKDYTVSLEEFDIYQCASCHLRFTQNAPDESAIAPYYKSENYISHSDKSKGSINRIYRMVRKRTLKKKRQLVEKFTSIKTGKLLEIGSGTGSFASEMQSAGWQVTGLEPDPDARKVAQETYGIQLLPQSDFYSLPVNSFDAITLWHVLEHVHDFRGYVKQFKLLMKDYGILFIAVPNYTSLDAEIYKQYWAGYDTPRHLFHFAPQSMKFLVEQEGLKLEDMLPMWYDSFYVSLLSSRYKNYRLPGKQGKPSWPAALWTGLWSNLKAVKDIEKCSSLIYIISKRSY